MLTKNSNECGFNSKMYRINVNSSIKVKNTELEACSHIWFTYI